MRRMTTLLIATLIATSLAPSSFARDGDRTVTKNYTIFRGQISFNSQEVAWIGTQPESFRTRAGERWLTVTLEDGTGNPVRGRVQVNGETMQFCSSTEEPIPIRPRQKVRVSAIFGPCDGGLSFVTEGTITATFSR